MEVARTACEPHFLFPLSGFQFTTCYHRYYCHYYACSCWLPRSAEHVANGTWVHGNVVQIRQYYAYLHTPQLHNRPVGHFYLSLFHLSCLSTLHCVASFQRTVHVTQHEPQLSFSLSSYIQELKHSFSSSLVTCSSVYLLCVDNSSSKPSYHQRQTRPSSLLCLLIRPMQALPFESSCHKCSTSPVN